ncbi:MAG: carboxypeptidase regulatory-like domain-containing protein [Gemmatimonadales bacterium]
MRRPLLWWLVVLGNGLPSASVQAQGRDASFVGIVRTATGEPVADAAIDVLNAETGVRLRVTTDRGGRFLVLNVPLGGPYLVTVRRIGFRPSSQGGIRMVLGERRHLTFELEPAAVELAPLEVTSSGGPRREDRVGGSYRIDLAQVRTIPTQNRDFADLASMSSLVGPQLSIAGQRWTATGFSLDGVQSRNQLRAGTSNGGPFAVSLEAIREFEVNTNVYEVTQGRQAAGEVSAATRAGTNRWQGSAYSYFRSQSLGAATDFDGRARSARPFTAIQWGASVGGPIVRDRLHFFAVLERQDGSQPLLVGLLDTPSAEDAAGLARDSLNRIISVLVSKYGTTGSQLGKLPRSPTATSLFGRADWAISTRHLLTIRQASSFWTNPLSGGVDQPIALREARSDFASAEHQSLLRLRSTFSSSSQHNLKFGFSHSKRELTPVTPGVPRGFVQTRSLLPNGSTGNATIQFGGNRLAPDLSREWQLQLGNELVLQRGNLLITFGTDHSLARLTTLIAEAQSGLFTFPSIAALDARAPSRYQRTVPLSGMSPESHLTEIALGAFGQVEWKPNESLAMLLGLRWDGTGVLSTPARNRLLESTLDLHTDRRPSDWSGLAPRAQLLYHADRAGRHLFRLGGGRFIGELPAYAFHNQLLYTGLTLGDVDFRGPAVPVPDYTAYRRDPSLVPGLPPDRAAPPGFVNVVGSSFALPSTWKSSLTYAFEASGRSGASVTLSAAWGRKGYHYIDQNLRPTPAFTLANEGGRGIYVPASTIPAGTGLTSNRDAVVSPLFTRVLALESIGKSSQHALTAEVHLRPGVQSRFDLSYTWSSARDNSTFGCCLARTSTTFTPVVTDPRDLSKTWGPSDFDIRHRIVFAGSVPVPGGFVVSGQVLAVSGRPYSLVVDGDLNGDEASGNDLAFLFDPDDPNTPADVAASMRKILADPANLAAPYIASHLGQVSSRNALRLPWSVQSNLRIARPISLDRGEEESRRVDLIVDLFNVLNALDARWGGERAFPLGISSQNPVVNRIPLLRIVGFDPATLRFRYAVNEQAGVLPRGGQRYQFQIGVRISQ